MTAALSLFVPVLDSEAACPNGASTNYINATVGDACFTVGATYYCDATGASAAAVINIVEDYESDSTWEAWGTIDGVDFCHDQSFTGIDTVVIKGLAQYGDTLSLTDGSVTYRMAPAPNTIDVFVYGYGANDVIYGSGYDDGGSAPAYNEHLYGGFGDDTIHGRDGDDEIFGEDGQDTINAGGGDDDVYGDQTSAGACGSSAGDDHDVISGGAGVDEICGNGGGDFISGGDDNDIINGGPGGDVICGDGGIADYMYDGDATDEGATHDKLWGNDSNTTDEADCTAGGNSQRGNNRWDSGSTCHATTLGTKPSQCP